MKTLTHDLWLLLTAAAFFGFLANASLMFLKYGKAGQLRWWFRGISFIFCAVAYEILTAEVKSYNVAAEAIPVFAGVFSLTGRLAEVGALWGWFAYAIARNGSDG